MIPETTKTIEWVNNDFVLDKIVDGFGNLIQMMERLKQLEIEVEELKRGKK